MVGTATLESLGPLRGRAEDPGARGRLPAGVGVCKRCGSLNSLKANQGMTYEYENIVRIIFSTIAIISILLHVSNMSLELVLQSGSNSVYLHKNNNKWKDFTIYFGIT